MNKLLKSTKSMIIALALVIGVIATAVTMAVVVASTDTLYNKFHVAEVETHIEEKLDDQPVKANSHVLKIPQVINDGKSNAFIRARATITPSDAGVWLMEGEWSALEGADKVFSQQGIVYNGTTFMDNGNWIYCQEDGFYYYNLPVAAQAATESLFDAVVLQENADITIYQEAVLAQNIYALDETVEVATIRELFDSVTR